MEKSLEKNALINVINKGVHLLFPLITVAYLSRTLGPGGIGEVSAAQNLTAYFTMFAALGIPSYGIRAISQTRKDVQKCNETFSALFLINLLSTVCSVLVYFVVLWAARDRFDSTLSLIFSSLIILNIANVEWLYAGFEEYQYITIRSIFVKIVSLILLFLLVKDSTDVAWYAVIVCFGTCGNYLLNVIKLRKYVTLSFRNISIKQHVAPIIVFFASVIAIDLYSLLDVTMLTMLEDKVSVGYYTNATKIVKMISGVLTSITAVLMPRFSYYFAEKNYEKIKEIGQRFLNVTFLIGLPACLGVTLLSDQIVSILLSDTFLPTAKAIRILAPLIILMPMSGGVFCQILISSGEEKKYFWCVLLGVAVNALLNGILIPRISFNGAAVASVISEIVVTGSMVALSTKVIKVPVAWGEIFKILVAAAVMAISLAALQRVLTFRISYIFLLMAEVIFGAAVYFAVLLITKCRLLKIR